MAIPDSTPSSSAPTVSAAPSTEPASAGASNQPPAVSSANATVEQEEPADVTVTVDRTLAAVLASESSHEELALRVARYERYEAMEQALRQTTATSIGVRVPTADQFATTVAGRAATSKYNEQAIAALERSGIVLGASRRSA